MSDQPKLKPFPEHLRAGKWEVVVDTNSSPSVHLIWERNEPDGLDVLIARTCFSPGSEERAQAICDIWNTRQPERPDVRTLEAATMNVCHRLEWAIQFIGALVPTKDGFKLDYEKANWDNADEWMPIAKRELTACIAALAQPEAKGGGENNLNRGTTGGGNSPIECQHGGSPSGLSPDDSLSVAAPGSGPSTAASPTNYGWMHAELNPALRDIAENPVHLTQQMQDIASTVLAEEMGQPAPARHREPDKSEPHPDTLRLDWLDAHPESVDHLHACCDGGFFVEGYSMPTKPTIRAAIDAARQAEKGAETQIDTQS